MTRGRLVRRAALVGAVGVAALLAYVILPISDDRPEAVEVVMTDFAFEPSSLEAVPGQRLHVSNEGSVTHSLVIVGLGKGVELPPGADAEMRLPFDSAGEHRLVCDIPGHAEAGMTGHLTIGG